MATEPRRSVDMIHYECRVCPMAATMVANESASRAWADHMETHHDATDYGAWTWTVVELPL